MAIGMVSYLTMVYVAGIFGVMLLYTVLYDLYLAFWDIAYSLSGGVTELTYLYTLYQWIPAIFLLSMTFWYLKECQSPGGI